MIGTAEMIGTAGIVLDWAAGRRRKAWERVSRRGAEVQERTLLRMVRTARNTAFGRQHGFEAIRSVTDYQARVPIADYLAFAPLFTRTINGEADVTWPGRARYWVKTSGTTAGDKCIPVTREALAAHRKGGWDAFYLAVEKASGEHLLGGQLLFLGGSTVLKPFGEGCRLGDLSGVVARRLPGMVRKRYSPGPEIAGISDWAARLHAMAPMVMQQDLRLIGGMPSWMILLFETIAAARRASGLAVESLGRCCWPNLRVFIHGGVAYPPYGRVVDEWIGRPLDRVEVYPASEGFVAVQTEAWGLTLMLDYGIFYEFIPLEDLGSPTPRRHTVANVEMDRSYALALTAPSGLWSYLLGDTVRFASRDPLRLQIIGRTRHFVNAFGENVIVEEVEQALLAACRKTGADVAEFTVAPRYPSDRVRGAHQWLIEFRDVTPDLDQFGHVLDARLQALNTDYRTKRTGDVGMVAPQVTPVPAGTFYAWMAAQGKLGDQHKVPRVTNNRDLIEAILRRISTEVPAQETAAGT